MGTVACVYHIHLSFVVLIYFSYHLFKMIAACAYPYICILCSPFSLETEEKQDKIQSKNAKNGGESEQKDRKRSKQERERGRETE